MSKTLSVKTKRGASTEEASSSLWKKTEKKFVKMMMKWGTSAFPSFFLSTLLTRLLWLLGLYEQKINAKAYEEKRSHFHAGSKEIRALKTQLISSKKEGKKDRPT